MFKVFYKKIKKASEVQKSNFLVWALRLVVGLSLGAMASLFLFQGIESELYKRIFITINNNQINKDVFSVIPSFNKDLSNLTDLSPALANDSKEYFGSYSDIINEVMQGKSNIIIPLHHTGGGSLPPVLGEQKIAVLLVNFKNTAQPVITKSEAENTIFIEANNYYKEISYNKIFLSGNVFGWYQILLDQTCDPDATTKEAMKIADPDVYFPDYDGVMIITPSGCASRGGKSFRSSTNDGDVDVFQVVISGWSLGIIAHELGHAFGNYHAGLSGCFSDYCDPFDVMGVFYRVGHFNAPHKEHVGWLDSSSVQAITSSGSYSLEPIETISSGVKAVKIKRSSRSFLYIEYRRPVGYDAVFKDTYTANIFDGALMHTTGGLAGIGFTSVGSVDTFLIDPTPSEDKSFAVKVGENYVDPATKTKITVMSISDSTLNLNIDLGVQDNTGPTISIAEPEESETVSGEIEIISEVSDPAGIDHVYFVLNNKARGDSSDPFSASFNTVDPSAKWADGTYNLNATAYDGAFNSTYLPTMRSIKLDNSIVLSQINNPQPDSLVRDVATISLSSSARSISKADFFKDFEKTPFFSAVSAPFEASWDTKKIADGTYRLKAKIYYSDGNFSTSKVSITVDNTAPSEPSNFKITSANTASEIDLDWDDSADALGIKNYRIYRDDIEIAAISESRYLDSKLSPSTTYIYQISAIDNAGNESARSQISITTLPALNSSDSDQGRLHEPKIENIIATPALKGGPQLRLFKSDGTLVGQFFAYEKSFRGGVSFVTEDLDNDGVREVITAPGSGREPEIRIFNSKGRLLYKFLAYSKNFHGGVNVASGDLNGDGKKDIITSPRNGTPQVRIFNFKGSKWTQVIKAFFAYSKNRNYAANIAIADIDGDGKDEIITAPGVGGVPALKVFGLRNNEIKQITPQIYAYDKNIRGGVNLSAGDIDGDGNDEIIVSPSTENLDVKVFKKASNGRLVVSKKGFFPFGKNTKQGINTVAADMDGDGKDEIISSIAGAGQSIVRIFSSDKFKKLKEFKAYSAKSMFGLRIGKW